jgi:hypothetical protein
MSLHAYYQHGKLHGELRQWDKFGDLIEHSFWYNGEEISDEIYELITDVNNVTEQEQILIKLAAGS